MMLNLPQVNAKFPVYLLNLDVVGAKKEFSACGLSCCGGGDPGCMGNRSLVGLGCCTNNSGMMSWVGRFEDLSSGVGGATSIAICTDG